MKIKDSGLKLHVVAVELSSSRACCDDDEIDRER